MLRSVEQHAEALATEAKRRSLDFFYYFFASAQFDMQFDERRLSDARSRTSAVAIECAIRVPLPPLAEQKAIAAVLGALDDKIELNRRMNATLEAMARALFQSWFVDFDPVRAKLDGRQPPGLDPATAALFPAALPRLRSSAHPERAGVIAAIEEVCHIEPWRRPERPLGDARHTSRFPK